MRKIVAQLIQTMGDRLWPRAPAPPEVKAIDDRTREDVAREEQDMRAELVRAQTDALRLRVLQEQQD